MTVCDVRAQAKTQRLSLERATGSPPSRGRRRSRPASLPERALRRSRGSGNPASFARTPERALRRSRGSENPASFGRTRHWVPAFAGTTTLAIQRLCPNLRSVVPAEAGTQRLSLERPNVRSVVPAEAGSQRLSLERALRRSRRSENPASFARTRHWVPAFAGTTTLATQRLCPNLRSVVPAEAGTQRLSLERPNLRSVVPAEAGTQRGSFERATGSPPSRGRRRFGNGSFQTLIDAGARPSR